MPIQSTVLELAPGNSQEFFVFKPTDVFPLEYPENLGVLRDLQSPIVRTTPPDQLLPPLDHWEHLFSQNANAYKSRKAHQLLKRHHAYHLASKGLQRDVNVLTRMFGRNLAIEEKFLDYIQQLDIIVQGRRYKWNQEPDLVAYQVDQVLFDDLNQALDDVGKRTIQVSPFPLQVPKPPSWGNLLYPKDAYLSKNDFSILATTFRHEVETYLSLCYLFNYDFEPYISSPEPEGVAEEVRTPESEEDPAEDTSRPIVTPKRLDPTIREFLNTPYNSPVRSPLRNLSRRQTDSPSPPSRRQVHFSDPVSTSEASGFRRASFDQSEEIPPKSFPTNLSSLRSPANIRDPPPPSMSYSIGAFPHIDSQTLPGYQQLRQDRLRDPNVRTSGYPVQLGSDRFQRMFEPFSPGLSSGTLLSFNPQQTSSIPNNPSFLPSTSLNQRSNNPPSGPPNDDDGDDDGPGRRGPSGLGGSWPPRRAPSSNGGNGNSGRPDDKIIKSGEYKFIDLRETHFDVKLKPDIVPMWNGNMTELPRWIETINELSRKSNSVFIGLGDIVPTRFRDSAREWWLSLPPRHRQSASTNWDTLREEIRVYWMNKDWLDSTTASALRCRYRESGHTFETPSQYYLRKYELLSLVMNFTDSQIIHEVMKQVPPLWNTVVPPRSFQDLVSFQTALRENESTLLRLGTTGWDQPKDRVPNIPPSRVPFKPNVSPAKPNRFARPQARARSNLVGQSRNLEAPKFPRDDKVISKGRTPEEAGARPCRHCGSPKHWDPDCRYAKQGMRAARANLASWEEDDFTALDEYEELYYAEPEEAASEEGTGDNLIDLGESPEEDQNPESPDF